ncbi:competence protein ComEC [Marinobacter segnicrescens]|uniref:Competence protein ComEC n=1 Tax=Marinobacter segnicrescens TaxID=430453 RepID=A0A1I0G8Y6_9GAMM|nr:DNA internalization-related competence protein ComEC/Rec2 [Marinobacter segnicrescens]SET67304.1 competence protein ComEC [Marinobacter segnicrescens]
MGTRIAAFACGVIILYSGLFTPPWVLLCTGLVLIVIAARRRLLPTPVVLILCCLLAGLAWSSLFAQWRLSDRLDPALEGQPLTVSGYLCSAPAPGAWGSVRFSLCLDGNRPSGVPGRLRLAWYGDDTTLAVPTPMTATVVLKRPHGVVNPGGFRYETWLFRKGYGATGSVRNVLANPAGSCGLACHYHRWRQRLVQSADAALDGTDHKALTLSLLLGYRGQLDNAHWDVLQATGTVHLVAISGLHLGLVAGITGLLLRGLFARLPTRGALLPGQRHGTWLLVVAAAVGYALLAGFTVPTRRAMLMVAIAGWLILGGRITGPWQAWLMALGLVLVTDPLGPLDQGFWLSFGAVAILILMFSRLHGRPGPVMALVLAQAAVFAGLWPILAILGQGAAWAGLLANIVAIPWLSLLVMPLLLGVGAILLVTGGFLPGPVHVVLDAVLGSLWWVLVQLAQIELPAGRLPVWIASIVAIMVLLALWLPENRFRLASSGMTVLLLVLHGSTSHTRWQPTPRIWVWDVGQGLSVLVHHQDQSLLYDTGPESASGYNAVSEVLRPSLERIGVNTIDTLVVSHGDRDHAGGLSELLTQFRPGRIIAGEPGRLSGDAAEAAEPCRGQSPLLVGQVTVSFWQAEQRLTGADANDRSCVLILAYAGHQVLLPGDISRITEQQLMADHPGLAGRAGELTVVAPHHGSKTSSGPKFVNGLAPERVIFTAGYRHRYGHPHPEVVARYHDAGSELLNTATSGALRLDLGQGGADITEWRQGGSFWIRAPERPSPTRSE